MPLGHIGINASDLEVSYSYYEALMPYLRYEQFLAHDDQFAIRPSDNKVGTYIFFYPAEDIYHPTFAGLASCNNSANKGRGGTSIFGC